MREWKVSKPGSKRGMGHSQDTRKPWSHDSVSYCHLVWVEFNSRWRTTTGKDLLQGFDRTQLWELLKNLCDSVVFTSQDGTWSLQGREDGHKVVETKDNLEPMSMSWTPLKQTGFMSALTSSGLDKAGVLQEKLCRGAEHMTDHGSGEPERAGRGRAIACPTSEPSVKWQWTWTTKHCVTLWVWWTVRQLLHFLLPAFLRNVSHGVP